MKVRYVSKQNHDSKSEEERKRKEKLFCFFLHSVISFGYQEDIIICIVAHCVMFLSLNYFFGLIN